MSFPCRLELDGSVNYNARGQWGQRPNKVWTVRCDWLPSSYTFQESMGYTSTAHRGILTNNKCHRPAPGLSYGKSWPV